MKALKNKGFCGFEKSFTQICTQNGKIKFERETSYGRPYGVFFAFQNAELEHDFRAIWA